MQIIKDYVKPSEKMRLTKRELAPLYAKMMLDEQYRLKSLQEFAKSINNNLKTLSKHNPWGQ